jgi:energy-coupling factor transport system substrate-specific component
MVVKGRARSDFSTLTLALIPVAIVINIVIGQIVQNVLKLPIYLDSIGTVLVGALAGPLAGAITGALSNLIWGYLLPSPIGSTTIGPFAIVAAVIGLLAAFVGYGRWRLVPLRGSTSRPTLQPS